MLPSIKFSTLKEKLMSEYEEEFNVASKILDDLIGVLEKTERAIMRGGKAADAIMLSGAKADLMEALDELNIVYEKISKYDGDLAIHVVQTIKPVIEEVSRQIRNDDALFEIYEFRMPQLWRFAYEIFAILMLYVLPEKLRGDKSDKQR